MSTFRGLGEVIAENGLSARSTPIGPRTRHTLEGGGVDKDNPTQVGRALAQIELIAYSPQARGRSERMFICPRSCASPGSPPWPRPIGFSRKLFWPAHHRPMRPYGRGNRLGLRGSCRHARGHPLHPGGPRRRVRQHRALQEPSRCQIPADRHRHHYVMAQVRKHAYPDGHLAVFHGPRCLERYRVDGETIDDDRLQAAYRLLRLRIPLPQHYRNTVTVEADTLDEALEKAIELAGDDPH